MIKNTFRSSIFISSFITSYQALLCLWKQYSPVDWKYIYYINGLLSAGSIFLEHPNRRLELTLYVLPKGLMSLYLVLLNRGRMIYIPGFNVGLSGIGMFALMYSYTKNTGNVSPILSKIMVRLLGHY
jgi:hypothetical protein